MESTPKALYGIAARPRMASAVRLHPSFSFVLDFIHSCGMIAYSSRRNSIHGVAVIQYEKRGGYNETQFVPKVYSASTDAAPSEAPTAQPAPKPKAPASSDSVAQKKETVKKESANKARKAMSEGKKSEEKKPDTSNVHKSEKDAGKESNEISYSPSDDASIKEQIREHLDELNESTSVDDVEYDPADNQIYLSKVSEVFKKAGNRVDRLGFGIIEIGRSDISKADNYVHTNAERAAMLAIPRILKRGIEISGHINHKSREYDTITIAAKITINGKPAIVGAVVGKIEGKNRYRVHRVLALGGGKFVFEKKTDAEPTPGKLSSTEGERVPIGSASNNSISHSAEKVNPKSEKKFCQRQKIRSKRRKHGRKRDRRGGRGSHELQTVRRRDLRRKGDQRGKSRFQGP